MITNFFNSCACNFYVSADSICDATCRHVTSPKLEAELKSNGSLVISTTDPSTGVVTTTVSYNTGFTIVYFYFIYFVFHRSSKPFLNSSL